MARKKLDQQMMAALRQDAREAEREADSRQPYPGGTHVSRPNAPSRVFNLRLSDEQFAALQEVAQAQHLPVSTMARAWLLDRLDRERRAS